MPRPSSIAATTLAAMLSFSGRWAAADTTYTGDVTAYSSDWEGHNCGFTSLWGQFDSAAKTHFAAMNNPMWDNKMNCGRCARVTCTSPECAQNGGKPITVMITDRCPECAQGALDLSIQGFKELTGTTPSRYKIEWQFVDCPSTFVQGNVEYYIKPGSNRYWVAIQPRNYKKVVTKMQVKASSSNSWFTLADPSQNNIDSYYFLAVVPGGFPDGPFQVRSYAADGTVIEDTFQTLPLGTSMYATHQFAASAGSPPSSPTYAGSPSSSPAYTTSPSSSPAHAASPSSSPAYAPSKAPPAPTAVAPSSPTTNYQVAPSPPVSPTSLSCSACPFGITSTVTEWAGGYAFHVTIDNSLSVALKNWHVHVESANFGSAVQSWNCQGRANNQGYGFEMMPETYNSALTKGQTNLVLIATTKNTQQPAAVANGMFYFVDANGIPGSCPITMSGAPEQLASALAVENATNSSSVSGPLSIVAITCALVGVVGAVLLVMYVRRQLRQRQEEPAIMTPGNFEVFTPVSVL